MGATTDVLHGVRYAAPCPVASQPEGPARRVPSGPRVRPLPTRGEHRRMAARPVSLFPLPPQPTTFVGRAAEVAALTRLLAEPDCRLVTIVGPGGIGKTRLALEVAASAAPAFDGVAFAPLQGVPA